MQVYQYAHIQEVLIFIIHIYQQQKSLPLQQIKCIKYYTLFTIQYIHISEALIQIHCIVQYIGLIHPFNNEITNRLNKLITDKISYL